MGIDFGMKHIGVALSDESRSRFRMNQGSLQKDMRPSTGTALMTLGR